jgi:hypothetical protein
VPALITPTEFTLAQERFEQNRRFAARHTKRPSLLQGEGFLTRLHDAAKSLDVTDRQRVLRLVVKEVQVGPEAVVIKHSIPCLTTIRTPVIYCVHGITMAEMRSVTGCQLMRGAPGAG